MTSLLKSTTLLLSFFALNTFANDTMVSQMTNGFLSSFFSFFLPIVALGAILSVSLSLAQKKPKILAYGCGGIFLLLLIGGLILAIVEFVKAHSTFFIVGGILLILIIIIGAFVFKATQTEEFPEDVEPTFPKNFKSQKFQYKQRKSPPKSTRQETKPFTPEELSVHPATYEDVVGKRPSAKEIVGKIGEDAVSKAVYAACELDSRHYKLLRNVYIPKQDGDYSEIDVLLLHETGVYVFESKNLSGSVYGDMDHLQWQRYKKNGEKEYIPNPIKQNEGHIRTLCDFLEQNKYQLRSFSMIVFGSKSQLKFVPNDTVLTSIHEVYNLEMDLIRKMQAQQEFYSVETIDEWCKKLLPCTMLSEEEKQAHKDRITKKFKQNLRH